MVREGWIKKQQKNGPDTWEFKNEIQLDTTIIAFLKLNDKVIAKFIGPIHLKNKIIIDHIKSAYTIDKTLILHRILPLPHKDISIKPPNSY